MEIFCGLQKVGTGFLCLYAFLYCSLFPLNACNENEIVNRHSKALENKEMHRMKLTSNILMLIFTVIFIAKIPDFGLRIAERLSLWTKQVRVSSGNGMPLGDGHIWRKYGQKEILGAKYPR
ncbi:putative transcription factor WRKY family [Rosa chinensis]|uniref:Putative transcription factor WRKY family n=1 Tax=Rosa chinensis TaxID=74649 RepID=A0A2P6QE75_ROSCH|nr:putative transcription factor WRKY family [Rosa chinensis]